MRPVYIKFINFDDREALPIFFKPIYFFKFTIDLAHKDLSLVVEAANTQAVSMPMAAAAREAFNLARSRGFGGDDFSAMLDVHCDLNQLDAPRLSKGSKYKPN